VFPGSGGVARMIEARSRARAGVDRGRAARRGGKIRDSWCGPASAKAPTRWPRAAGDHVVQPELANRMGLVARVTSRARRRRGLALAGYMAPPSELGLMEADELRRLAARKLMLRSASSRCESDPL
jgi:hypothetical protein